MQSIAPTEETTALLTRLASRPNVRSTLILSRDDGAIVRSTGLLSAEDEVTTTGQTEGEEVKRQGVRNAEELARLVWAYTQSSAELINNIHGPGDDVSLCRLRSRHSELLIVPDNKYLLVVVHDAPSS